MAVLQIRKSLCRVTLYIDPKHKKSLGGCSCATTNPFVAGTNLRGGTYLRGGVLVGLYGADPNGCQIEGGGVASCSIP